MYFQVGLNLVLRPLPEDKNLYQPRMGANTETELLPL